MCAGLYSHGRFRCRCKELRHVYHKSNVSPACCIHVTSIEHICIHSRVLGTGPPLEEHLAQSSLWPEIAKLYGHGAELFCVAASPSGDVLASACKAQTSSTAAVWLWDTTTWAALGSLTAHSLTVTQLRFSPDGRWLLSVSRDRTVAVYQRGTGMPVTHGIGQVVVVLDRCKAQIATQTHRNPSCRDVLSWVEIWWPSLFCVASRLLPWLLVQGKVATSASGSSTRCCMMQEGHLQRRCFCNILSCA